MAMIMHMSLAASNIIFGLRRYDESPLHPCVVIALWIVIAASSSAS